MGVDIPVRFKNKNITHTCIAGSPQKSSWKMCWNASNLLDLEVDSLRFALGISMRYPIPQTTLVRILPRRSSCKIFITLRISNLLELASKGPRYTWSNEQVGDRCVMERIDKALVNTQWLELFSKAHLIHESFLGSDHYPLVLMMEEKWKLTPSYFEVIQQAWLNSGMADQTERGRIEDTTAIMQRCKRALIN
ncbi:conserved hypothetical protein [Ricinus communis]|uniref:Endonuclease/exonuclease/phosphatase domain-containing protein n=1 Tax=Ricinus communis TaxID=3988 RepID=B9SPN6_RICCO|nr:conserved hypothetical protein [Ricinus communis]